MSDFEDSSDSDTIQLDAEQKKVLQKILSESRKYLTPIGDFDGSYKNLIELIN